jgi:high-affinity K+ transport system ATPase subunit B
MHGALRICLSNRQTVKRFVMTVLAATLLHAVACILVPPFEFAPTRSACFFYAFISGLMVFPILFASLLLPLQAGLRRFLPSSTPRTRAIVAGVVLIALVVVMILPRQLAGVPLKPHQHSYFAKWTFWLLFAAAVDLSFFWPFGARIHDHALERCAASNGDAKPPTTSSGPPSSP